MLIVISPAKTLDYEAKAQTDELTLPEFTKEPKELVAQLRQLAPQDISKLMSISDKLGTLNHDRFQQWKPKPTVKNAKQALLAFKGDVYTGMAAETFKKADLNFAQKHLRILSGLYGILKPLDLMQAYRLEMGTKFATAKGKDLYEFWGEKITNELNGNLKASKSKTLINLASNEYFKAVKPKLLQGEIISPVFKDWNAKSKQYKIISFYAKKARGMMAAYIIKDRLKKPEQILGFDTEGYQYNKAMSTSVAPVFLRKI